MTMNSAASLVALHRFSSTIPSRSQTPNPTPETSTATSTATSHAELIREVSLKCIGFNGVPRTINVLGAFHSSLSPEITARLTNTPTRRPTPANIDASNARGDKLWNSIYTPFSGKLIRKLSQSHPDLPEHILYGAYGLLFSDPPRATVPGQSVGRIATSLIAIACLRAQSGVGPQVISHLFGLRKALEDGSWKEGLVDGHVDGKGERLTITKQTEDGVRWLASDEGGVWILESVDAIVDAIGEGGGSSFAPGSVKAKL